MDAGGASVGLRGDPPLAPASGGMPACVRSPRAGSGDPSPSGDGSVCSSRPGRVIRRPRPLRSRRAPQAQEARRPRELYRITARDPRTLGQQRIQLVAFGGAERFQDLALDRSASASSSASSVRPASVSVTVIRRRSAASRARSTVSRPGQLVDDLCHVAGIDRQPYREVALHVRPEIGERRQDRVVPQPQPPLGETLGQPPARDLPVRESR